MGPTHKAERNKTALHINSFPIGAQNVYNWRYQKELEDDRAYIIGHAARNVRCSLNIAAEVIGIQVKMGRVFAALKQNIKEEEQIK